jgi:hypothetical protein
MTTAVSAAALEDGSAAGLIVFGRDYAWIGVRRQGKAFVVITGSRREADKGADADRAIASLASAAVQLRVSVESGGRCRFAYSVDGREFVAAGDVFTARPGVWVGAKTGLFVIPADGTNGGGHADWDWFRVEP